MRGWNGAMGEQTFEGPAPSGLGSRIKRSGATGSLPNWPAQRTKNTIKEFRLWDNSSFYWRRGSTASFFICRSSVKISVVFTSSGGTDTTLWVLVEGLSRGWGFGVDSLTVWRGGSGEEISQTSIWFTVFMRELDWRGRWSSDGYDGKNSSWFKRQTEFSCAKGVGWAFLAQLEGGDLWSACAFSSMLAQS